MGYYTTIQTIPIILRKDIPEEIVNFITRCIEKSGIEDGEWTPDHKLFTLQRWENLFCAHACFDDHPYFKRLDNGYYEFYIHADINFAWQECTEFNKWISPYVAGRKKKQYIGWHKGEDFDAPRINMYVNR